MSRRKSKAYGRILDAMRNKEHMTDLDERIKELSLKDTKTISQMGLKLMEECGELAKIMLPFDNADGTRHRFVDRTALTDGVVDVLLVARSILYKLKIHDDKVNAMMHKKTHYWEKLQSLPSYDSYPYELHITVAQAPSYEQFLIDCKSIGVKAVVLDLHTKSSGIIKDVMTSSTMVGTNQTVIEEMDRITYELESLGYRVVRQKIETVPWHPHTSTERSDDNYFESHIPVTIRNDETAYEKLYYLIKRYPGCHLSRNALKQHNDDTVIYMVTMRHNDCNHDDFVKRVNQLRAGLAGEGYDISPKDMVEWAIYDNNVQHDSEWIEGEDE